ncbi:MAG: nucleotidyltransferase domain-containing protein [Atopobiaceae bacterium]|nr:nucleotidyltransferase domain-containing protein [Atopobiaceae bacterium]
MYSTTDARTLTSEIVSQRVGPVFERWGIERAWLYGSVARGTQTERSDVDLMVELVPDAGIGIGIVRLQDELEDVLGLDVDIHSVPDPKRTNPAFLRNYESSKVLVYEREAK